MHWIIVISEVEIDHFQINNQPFRRSKGVVSLIKSTNKHGNASSLRSLQPSMKGSCRVHYTRGGSRMYATSNFSFEKWKTMT